MACRELGMREMLRPWLGAQHDAAHAGLGHRPWQSSPRVPARPVLAADTRVDVGADSRLVSIFHRGELIKVHPLQPVGRRDGLHRLLGGRDAVRRAQSRRVCPPGGPGRAVESVEQCVRCSSVACSPGYACAKPRSCCVWPIAMAPRGSTPPAPAPSASNASTSAAWRPSFARPWNGSRRPPSAGRSSPRREGARREILKTACAWPTSLPDPDDRRRATAPRTARRQAARLLRAAELSRDRSVRPEDALDAEELLAATLVESEGALAALALRRQLAVLERELALSAEHADRAVGAEVVRAILADRDLHPVTLVLAGPGEAEHRSMPPSGDHPVIRDGHHGGGSRRRRATGAESQYDEQQQALVWPVRRRRLFCIALISSLPPVLPPSCPCGSSG